MSGVTVRFIGSGPYCYANSLAMMLGSAAPEPAVIEVLTESPFGAELLGGVTPFFSPSGWDPGIGLDAGGRITLARLLRRLAPTYEQLRASLPGGLPGQP